MNLLRISIIGNYIEYKPPRKLIESIQLFIWLPQSCGIFQNFHNCCLRRCKKYCSIFIKRDLKKFPVLFSKWKSQACKLKVGKSLKNISSWSVLPWQCASWVKCQVVMEISTSSQVFNREAQISLWETTDTCP